MGYFPQTGGFELFHAGMVPKRKLRIGDGLAFFMQMALGKARFQLLENCPRTG